MWHQGRSNLAAFVRAFGARWFIYVSGAPSVPSAVAAFFVNNDAAKILLALTAVMCFCIASFFVWRQEHQARLDAEAKLQKRGIELALIKGRFIDGDNPNPSDPRYLVLVSVKNSAGIAISDCILKGKVYGQDDTYAVPVCAPFSIRIDEVTHKPVLSFNIKTRDILLSSFSRDRQWSMTGLVFSPPETLKFIFQVLSSSASITQLTINASFETGDWEFTED